MNAASHHRSSRRARSAPPAPASTRPAKLLRGDKSDVPDDFVALLFGARRAGGPGRATRRTSLRRWPARPGRSCRAQARRAENPLRAPGRTATHLEVDLGARDRQRRHAVPGRLGDGRTRPSAGSTSRLVVHPVFAVERDKAGRLTAPPTRPAAARTRRAKASSTSMSSAIDDEARRAEIVAGAGAGARRRARLRAGLAADAGRVGEVDRRAQDQSAAAAGRRDRRGDPVPGMAGRRQFHLPRRARLHARRPRSDALEPVLETGLGMLRARDVRVLRAAARLVTITPEIRAFLNEPKR